MSDKMKKDEKSLLQSSNDSRKKSLLIGGGVVVGIIVLFLLVNVFGKKEEVKTDFLYGNVAEGDLKISFSGDGKIKNPKILDLSFKSSGEISEVYVKEGDMVEVDEKLALIDTRELELAVQKSRSNLQSKLVRVDNKRNERTDLHTQQAQQEVIATQQDVVFSKEDAARQVEESFDGAKIEIQDSFDELFLALEEIDEILEIDTSMSKSNIKKNFGNSIGVIDAENDYKYLKRDVNRLNENWNEISETEQAEITSMLEAIQSSAEKIRTLQSDLISLIENGFASASVSQTDLNSAKQNMKDSRNQIIRVIDNLFSAQNNIKKSLQNRNSVDSESLNKIERKELELENAETKESQSELQKSGDILILNSDVYQAQVELNDALYKLETATMKSPIQGEIISIKKQPGERVTSSDSFIQVLSDESFTTEILIDELDIVKIDVGQAANIELISLPGIVLTGSVVFVSNQPTEDVNGIVSYLVRISIADSSEPIKEGMSTSVEFITAERKNILLVPIDAVRVIDSVSYVLTSQNEKKVVKTGLSDGGNIEILEGLSSNEEIVINYAKISAKDLNSSAKKLSPEMKKRFLNSGFTEKEIKKMETGDIDEKLEKKINNFNESNGPTSLF